jgi:hypothetical protein
MYLFTNKHNMQVFVNSSSFEVGQFTVKLLKEQKQGLKVWTVNIIIFVAFNWSCLYISIVHHLLVDTITLPYITNLFASAICICYHCENTTKLTLANQLPGVKIYLKLGEANILANVISRSGIKKGQIIGSICCDTPCH